MDLTLDETQQQILDAVERIADRNGGVRTSVLLLEEDGYDDALHEALRQGGFLDLPITQGAGPLEAGLVVERVGRLGGLVAAGATGLVYPAVVGTSAPGPVAMLSSPDAPFRFGTHAKIALIDAGDEALVMELTPGAVDPVDGGRTGWPLGRLKQNKLDAARSLGPGAGESLRNWWRVALALEAAGAMSGALGKTVQYVKERVQFGRPIGSFQAIQHRLAHLVAQVEGARWLALKAAYDRADPVGAAAAATWAATVAPLVFRETQQMHGAMGFTREYPLHAWTMRLPALQRELGGAMQHARHLTRQRFAA